MVWIIYSYNKDHEEIIFEICNNKALAVRETHTLNKMYATQEMRFITRPMTVAKNMKECFGISQRYSKYL